MTKNTMQPLMIGHSDTSDETENLTAARGVPQGSPASSTLFNILMDTLAESIMPDQENKPQYNRHTDITMLADDIKLQTTTKAQLQNVLKQCDEWATKNEMIWSVRKCAVMSQEDETMDLYLMGKIIAQKSQATYLGITTTAWETSAEDVLKEFRKLHCEPRGYSEKGSTRAI